MKVGDLVRHLYDTYLSSGLVTKVHFWQDLNSDRNVGVDIHVLWNDGKTRAHDEMELEIIISEGKN